MTIVAIVFLKFANHVTNDTIIDQNLQLPTNVIEVMHMVFPKEMPVLLLDADGHTRGSWKNYREDHLKRLGEHNQYKMIVGRNHQNIYHDVKHRRVVCEAIEEFIGR